MAARPAARLPWPDWPSTDLLISILGATKLISKPCSRREARGFRDERANGAEKRSEALILDLDLWSP
jgi:hypothetical protein